ncbi:hypothetical protein GCM10022226_59460 [Sphaerisporangium flaviroseum]|uniref:Uncharacterized protein n=1 Tax=Sphaerisporangium flaviroseum TaxID=509199 RepID=A0ABP7J0J3_9ACTN
MPGFQQRADLPVHDPGVLRVVDDRADTYLHMSMLSGVPFLPGCAPLMRGEMPLNIRSEIRKQVAYEEGLR